jgi:hypothetical protein
MDEVYTIGIRLALEDGSSGGIAALGAQVAALDRAVTAGLGVLGRLQETGGSEMDRPVAETVRQVPTASQAVAPPPEPLDVHASGAVRPQSALAAELRPAAAVRREDASTAALALHVSPAVPVPFARKVGMELATPQPRLEQLVGPVASGVSVAPPGVPPTGRLMPASQPVGLIAPSPPSAAPLQDRMAAWARGARSTAGEAAAPDRMDSRVVPTPGAERPGEMFALSALPRAGMDGGAQLGLAGASPDRPAREQTMAQGDIYLDGARMGRWIVERLAREAERPRSGGTSFDGRMSPAWGGTL